jgi:hypothetical protein
MITIQRGFEIKQWEYITKGELRIDREEQKLYCTNDMDYEVIIHSWQHDPKSVADGVIFGYPICSISSPLS